MRKIILAWKLAKSFALKEKKHFIIPVIAIGIGFAGLIVIISVIHGFDALLLDSLTGFFPHLLVDSTSKPVEDLEGISRVFRMELSEGILSFNKDFKGVIIYGADDEGIDFFTRFVLSGTSPKRDEILIGKALSESLELEPGDMVQITQGILSPLFSRKVKVSGILKTGVYQFDSNICIVNSEDNSGFWAIYLHDPRQAKKVKERLSGEISGNIYTWTELNEGFAKAVKVDELFALIITVFVVLLSGFGVMNAILYSVLTRRHEIGILSSLGLSPGYIAFVFWMQAIIVCIVGLLVGTVTGGISLFFISRVKVPLPEDVFYTTFLPVKVSLADFLIALAFELLLITIFSLFPSRHAGKIDPMEVLKYE
ncbi:hypothetical protein AT15_06890 [Kosmotoga arenicorallina S304]|uniref:ABC3 transporter permease C-terminal domain-containing protein n=1 Tax=Kosmotoga arenicorallina S304 TaxID=1453497 RepID=A0A182C7H6_9BACT|nr:FtsX-like permease family protein [Kosmotoga arenicorallina]OAA31217.1 hypothetical protein AT15_06890 [Kosmotoga arenicorallina S304]